MATRRVLQVQRLENRDLLAADFGAGEIVPDFSLLDTNPTSETYELAVSPRDYLGKVSAWYFGHAT